MHFLNFWDSIFSNRHIEFDCIMTVNGANQSLNRDLRLKSPVAEITAQLYYM